MPDFLGGKCKLFGAHKDGVGPWNDYEIVESVGIRKKQEAGDAPQIQTEVPQVISSDKEESKQ